jgi:hypothetical protein
MIVIQQPLSITVVIRKFIDEFTLIIIIYTQKLAKKSYQLFGTAQYVRQPCTRRGLPRIGDAIFSYLQIYVSGGES